MSGQIYTRCYFHMNCVHSFYTWLFTTVHGGSTIYCLLHIIPASGSLFVQKPCCMHSAYKDAYKNRLGSISFFFPTSFPVMSCGMPVPPVNGSIVGQDFSLGARATYQCNPGFRLAGPVTSSVICQESARWSPIEAPPRCVREYFSLPLLPAATASWVLKTASKIRSKIYPGKVDVKTEPNSGCSPSDFSAVTCPDIGHSAVEHGRWRLIYGTQNQYDAIMMLICDPGYYYRGQRVIRCQANSTWNYPDPRPVCDSKYKQTPRQMLITTMLGKKEN